MKKCKSNSNYSHTFMHMIIDHSIISCTKFAIRLFRNPGLFYYNLSMISNIEEEEVFIADGILECLPRFVQDVMYLQGSELAAQSEECTPAAGGESAQCVLSCLNPVFSICQAC